MRGQKVYTGPGRRQAVVTRIGSEPRLWEVETYAGGRVALAYRTSRRAARRLARNFVTGRGCTDHRGVDTRVRIR